MIAKKTVLSNFGAWLTNIVGSFNPNVVARVEGDFPDLIRMGFLTRDGLQVFYSGARSDLVEVIGSSGSALTRKIPITVFFALPTGGRPLAVEDMEALDDIEDLMLLSMDNVSLISAFGSGVMAANVQDSGQSYYDEVAIRFVYIEVLRTVL